MEKIFVTGTDTEVGKTLVSSSLMLQAQQSGLKVAGCKPVASGSTLVGNTHYNRDALELQQYSNVKLTYNDINPYLFEQAAAPHILAQQENVDISLSSLTEHCKQLTHKADTLIIEGAGGWEVPLNTSESLADLATQLECNIVLVVSIKLGCINHAILTQQSIVQRGLKILGWIANHPHPHTPYATEIVADLQQRLECQLIANIPYKSGLTATDTQEYFSHNIFNL